ncbi:acetylxylan esterase [Coleophoma crateriformis]|uniref:Acetylxylan esterase n=1 Tax=Coleophoma crateriformis TaxID=565419 RepID=A0A3D8S3N8_9HELO|nr:acetylxylan esterase [Coleophoma crateriformis]
MLAKSAVFAVLFNIALAAPSALLEARACPNVHVFGARETTASAGLGSAGTVVNLILAAYSGATSEAIDYPAAGGTNSAYAASVVAGVKAVTSQVTTYAQQCPSTQIVLVGYSQGAQIIDDAMCGGGDTNQGITDTSTPISTSVASLVKAMIWMGNPRNIPGASYSVGTATADGFDPRTSGFSCSYASMIQSYCDATDPYCSDGTDAATHQGYGSEYGQAALTFVKSKLS